MSFRTGLNLALMSGLLFTLASCGNNDKKKSSVRQELNTMCEGLSCLSSVTWKIFLQGRSFPDKSRVDINGTTVLNECVAKQRYQIDRVNQPESLTLPDYTVPTKGDLKIEIIDMGYDCNSYSTFFSNNKVDFEYVKGAVASEIRINL